MNDREIINAFVKLHRDGIAVAAPAKPKPAATRRDLDDEIPSEGGESLSGR
jgi:hypothetical protein